MVLCVGKSLIAAPKAQPARDGSCTPLKPLRRRPWGGVQATARDPKLNEGDESLIAQEILGIKKAGQQCMIAGLRGIGGSVWATVYFIVLACLARSFSSSIILRRRMF